MAQGDVTVFDEFKEQLGEENHNMGSDSFRVSLHTGVIGTAFLANAATPDYSDYSAAEAAAGSSYTTTGEALATTNWSNTAGVTTFEIADVTTSWAQDGTGETNINTALIYNSTAAGSDGVGFMDMRAGGTTAVSLQDGAVTITWAASLFTIT